MVNLFETLAQAQNGQAADLMARQFKLNQEQAEIAMAALMPAFSQGFKRNASDPMGLANWMQALSSGQHAGYFEDMTRAFQPQGVAEGNGILGHLFGSKEVSRAVAAQAAQATGISQDIFKQMLPVIASTLMGGMFKQMTGQTQGQTASAANPLGQIMEQMMANAGMGGSVERNANPMDNPLGKALEHIFGNGQQVAPDDPDDNGRIPNPMNPETNPWGKILQDVLGGMQQKSAPQAQARQRSPYEDMVGDMFETGRKSQEAFQDQYQRSMEQIFDQYMQGMDRLGRR